MGEVYPGVYAFLPTVRGYLVYMPPYLHTTVGVRGMQRRVLSLLPWGERHAAQSTLLPPVGVRGMQRRVLLLFPWM